MIYLKKKKTVLSYYFPSLLIFQGGGGLVHQLRKSYSLTDLNSDEPDYGADLREITNDTGMLDIIFGNFPHF